MARVLLGWELGDGLGHVSRLLPIALKLREASHECLFAVRNLAAPFRTLEAQGFKVLQAPYAMVHRTKAPMGSLADILASVGFSDAEALLPLVQAWEDLATTLKVDLIVADYSPALCLSALGKRPVVAIGDHFTLPSAQADTFPPFTPGGRSHVDEKVLLEVVHQVQLERGAPAPPNLPSVFAEARRFIVTLPEMHVNAAPDAGAQVVGPLERLPRKTSRNPTDDYFGYLSWGAKGTAKVLRALAEAELRGSIYLRDATGAQRAELRQTGLVIHDQPQPLARAISKARLLIHHGGLGTAQAGLSVGRPQLLVPRHKEQAMNAAVLRKLGVGVAMMSGGRFEVQHFHQALSHVSNEQKFAIQAARLASDIASRGRSTAVELVAEACLQMLPSR